MLWDVVNDMYLKLLTACSSPQHTHIFVLDYILFMKT